MYLLIDGYNLLFSFFEGAGSLESKRIQMIEWIRKKFSKIHWKGFIVFDGAHRKDEESGRSYPSPLEIAFAPKGQSADEFIIDKIRLLKNKKNLIVITNDTGLRRHTKSLGARTMSNEVFLQWLLKKAKQKKSFRCCELKETPDQEKRLLEIFEKRFQESKDDFEGT